MRITDVELSGVAGADVRLNVDGFSGQTFHDVDIRPGDSIAVLADAFPERKEISGSIVFTVNGAVTSLPIAGDGPTLWWKRVLPSVFTTERRSAWVGS